MRLWSYLPSRPRLWWLLPLSWIWDSWSLSPLMLRLTNMPSLSYCFMPLQVCLLPEMRSHFLALSSHPSFLSLNHLMCRQTFDAWLRLLRLTVVTLRDCGYCGSLRLCYVTAATAAHCSYLTWLRLLRLTAVTLDPLIYDFLTPVDCGLLPLFFVPLRLRLGDR